jgi:hypothetical protein
MRLNGPRMAPKWPPDALRCPQDCLKMPQGGPGRNTVRQKQPEDPEAAQSEAATAQKQPNAARGSQEQPRADQEQPKAAADQKQPRGTRGSSWFQISESPFQLFPEQVHVWAKRARKDTKCERSAHVCLVCIYVDGAGRTNSIELIVRPYFVLWMVFGCFPTRCVVCEK